MEYKTIEKFLADLKKEFGREEDKTIKIVELKRLEQRNKTIKESVQEFKRAMRISRYKERSLVEEFK